MEYPEKPKKRNFMQQHPSVIILEVLIVIVAVVAAGRYIVGTGGRQSGVPTATPVRDAHALYEQGEAYLEAKADAQAVEAFTQAILAGYQPVSMAYFERGRAYFRLEKYQDAVDDFSLSLENDPECQHECHVDYYNRALAYEHLGSRAAALADYSSAIDTASDYIFAYQQRAALYFDTGNMAAGVRDWNTALELMEKSIVRRGLVAEGGTRTAEITRAGEQVHFTFEAEAGHRITLLAESTALDMVILLRDSSGKPLAFDDDSAAADSRNARIADFVIPEDGLYTTVVAAYDGESTGPFSLTMAVSSPRISSVFATRITPDNAASLIEVSRFARVGTGAVVWSADGRYFLENGFSEGVLLYDTSLSSPRFRQVVSLNQYSGAMAITADNELLALAEQDDILLYDVETGTRTAVLRDSSISIRSMAFSPDGRFLVANGRSEQVYLWATGTGEIARTLPSTITGISSSVAFSPDSHLVAVGGAGVIEIWNAQNGELVARREMPVDGKILSLAFSPNGERLAVSGEKAFVGLWDLTTGMIRQYSGHGSGHRGSVNAVIFSPDGQLIASAGADGTVRLWRLDADAAVAVLSGHEKSVQSLAFHEDGRTLVSAGEDATVRLWRVK